MSKSPAFQFYPGDWLSSLTVSSMTPAQEGAYIRLLALAWGENDCGLPDDDLVLAQLSRLGEGWLNGGSTLVRKCFVKRGDRIYNLRLLEERKKQSEWRKKSKEAGIKSGKSRREKMLGAEPTLTNGCHLVGTKCEPNTNSSSSSSSSSFNTKENTTYSCSEPDKLVHEQHPSQEEFSLETQSRPDKVYLTYECRGNPPAWSLCSKDLNIWHRVYGDACDVLKECQKAKCWLEANTSRRKTAKGMKKFLNGWIMRNVDRGTATIKHETEEPEICSLSHEEIQASFALAEKQRQAAIEAGLCDEKGELIIPEYEELKRYKAELEAARASN
jgi:uncharacterized protein YdaU (DUF1376 family)